MTETFVHLKLFIVQALVWEPPGINEDQQHLCSGQALWWAHTGHYECMFLECYNMKHKKKICLCEKKKQGYIYHHQDSQIRFFIIIKTAVKPSVCKYWLTDKNNCFVWLVCFPFLLKWVVFSLCSCSRTADVCCNAFGVKETMCSTLTTIQSTHLALDCLSTVCLRPDPVS